MRFRCLVTVLALGGLLVLSACGSSKSSGSGTSTPTRAKFTVGLVTDVGGLNDKSFNADANLGMKMAVEQLGVTGKIIESKTASDYVPNLQHFAQAGTGLTVGVGFLMQSAIYQVAKAYPGSKFAIVDGVPVDAKNHVVILSNVANLFFKEQESGYLVGVIAALMEKDRVGKATHNTIGVMGGQAIPPVNRYMAGYVAGAQRVNPSIKVLTSYSQSFIDTSAGAGVGQAQIARGADILFQVAALSGLGYLSAAQKAGLYGVGADADQSYLGSYIIASAVKRVQVAVEDTIREAQLGRFKSGNHIFSLRNHGTGFTASKAVPASIVKQAVSYAHLIATGKIVPPTTIPPH